MFRCLKDSKKGFLLIAGLLLLQPLFAQKLPRSLRNAFDFSQAGYHQGRELPARSSTNNKVFKVEDFGAVANDGKDDIEAIQRAVNAAEQAGGGVVLFPKGTFDFDVETRQRFVHIRKSNIVIRGWGEGIEGTVLHDHHVSHSPDPKRMWLGGTYPSFFKVGENLPVADSLQVVTRLQAAKAGSSTLVVQAIAQVQVGVYLLAQDNPADSSLTKELVFPLKKIGVRHAEPGLKYAQMVRVTRSEGNQISLDAPIHWRLDASWNPRLLAMPNLIEETGIENLRLISERNEPFIHHKSDEHDSGWDQIQVSCLENGWFRNIVHDSPTTAIAMKWVKNCVVYDCQVVGNRGHNGFVLSGGSTSNLFFNLKGGSTMHTYSMSGYGSGNVFYMCFTDEPSAIDCHGTLCHNNLFDNIYGAVVQNGGNSDALPPAHARGLIFYNLNTGYESAYNFRIKTELLAEINYPGIHLYGVRSQLGFPLHVKDSDGNLRSSDFQSPFAKAEKLNFQGALEVPSLFIWQYRKRYGFDFPQEPIKNPKSNP